MRLPALAVVVVLAVAAAGCGGDSEEPESPAPAPAAATSFIGSTALEDVLGLVQRRRGLGFRVQEMRINAREVRIRGGDGSFEGTIVVDKNGVREEAGAEIEDTTLFVEDIQAEAVDRIVADLERLGYGTPELVTLTGKDSAMQWEAFVAGQQFVAAEDGTGAEPAY